MFLSMLKHLTELHLEMLIGLEAWDGIRFRFDIRRNA